jgi:hypothetical protein
MMIILCIFGIVATALKERPAKPLNLPPASSPSESKQLLPQSTVKTRTLPVNPAIVLPAPFVSPMQYIDLTLKEAAKRLGKEPNEAGNVTIKKDAANIHVSTSGEPKISYVSIELKKMGACSQSQEFDSKPFLLAVGIDPSKLELARKQTHYHTYYDHNRKLKVFVTCVVDDWPYTVGISRKYYLQ